MQPNVQQASSEYSTRPADERYPTLDAMIASAQRDRELSAEKVYNLRDLRAVPAPHQVHLEGPKGTAAFTHYSFGQLARSLKAPAAFLRELTPETAATVINERLHSWAPTGTSANLLIKDDPAEPLPIVRAATSETYGRVWDASLYGDVRRHFGDNVPSNGGQGTDRVWQSPPTWDGGATPIGGTRGGQYRGDRDSFVIRIDGGSIVEDRSMWGRATSSGGTDSGAMFRGIMIRNSEVGHCSISIDTVLYRAICGNHILWGAVLGSTFRRRHVGTRVNYDTIRELLTIARKFNHRAASDDAKILQALIDHEIAASREALVDELRKMGATKDQAIAAYEMAERTETASPRSYWGISQGLTRISQESGYQDERLDLDALAAQVLKRGAVQYATV